MENIGHIKNPCRECNKREMETSGGLCSECQTIINLGTVDVKRYNEINNYIYGKRKKNKVLFC